MREKDRKNKIENFEFIREDNLNSPIANIVFQIKDKINEIINFLNEEKDLK